MNPAKKAPNRLINEKSPYLLQHAHNPVDWFPWGEEAFAKAKAEDKPIFLSIGYSTCHWCHVMERESFEDDQVAQALNRDYVAVKVDREERPDIDAVYMEACQAMTGAGGWPLTVLMTPEQKPFFTATYLPKTKKYGTSGLLDILPQVSRLWKTDRERLLETGDAVADALANRREDAPVQPEDSLLEGAVQQFRRSFDPANGGFGGAPKFPAPHNLLFLLARARQKGDKTALEMAERTLTQMYRGGLFDHIGGGFSRYSTDARWLVPHFEKMLYDNALLAYTYLEAYRQTKQPLYRFVAERTLEYVLRELRGREGGFFCGQDADSGGVEGAFYVFTPAEINAVLGAEAGQRFCARYGIRPGGNFEGKSIPNLLSNREADGVMDPPPESLLQYRRERMALHLDDKALTSWNALMIGALAKASRVLGGPYLEAAQKAQRFLAERLVEGGRLYVRWRDGEAAHTGQLDDYAFYAWALLELYAASFDAGYLREAAQMADAMEALFVDGKAGGYFLYACDAEQLISRPKEVYDGAMPSGNSVAALVLLRLERLTGCKKWAERARRQMAFLAGNIRDYPAGHSFALLAIQEALSPSRELVCACAGEVPDGLPGIAEHLRAVVKTRGNAGVLAEIAPFTAEYPLPASGAAYYLCENGACAAPADSLEALQALLGKTGWN